mmetsp:Transcript_12835/g.21718  ORF Transcript_12835/g.21718 Transcript_12835/m.21718 type:complete len:236 (-) Transcript_12835:78-785(-)
MKLNEMRNMKEPNYTKLRNILRTPETYGDQVLKEILLHADDIGIGLNAYNLVYEGFWDLYCRKPSTSDLNSKKLEGWANLVHLKPSVWTPAANKEEEAEPKEEENLSPANLPIKAVARIRIPFKRPVPEEGEEEGGSRELHDSIDPSNLEEIECEDRVLTIPTLGDTYRILTIHQLSQRRLREQIAKEFKEYMPELQNVDEEEMLASLERDAEDIEEKFFEKVFPDLPVFDFEIN